MRRIVSTLKEYLICLLALAAMLLFATSCSENDGPDFPKRDYELNPKLTKTLKKRALYDEKVDDLLNLWVYQYVFEYTGVGSRYSKIG